MVKEYVYYITDEHYERAAAHGIDRDALNRRVRYLGWDIERAMTEPKIKRTYKLDKGLVKRAAENGISRCALYYRLKEKGMDPEEAVTMPPLSPEEIGKLGNESRRKYSPEIIKLAESNGISYKTFKQRVNRGMSWDEAATKPIMTKQEIARENRRKGKINFG